ncbi:MAG: DUF4097 domain-containing protein [Ruminococcaceae bacterium]|nr:DUF4097 domain-containing protein [Oscillospiraceae bacterium]
MNKSYHVALILAVVFLLAGAVLLFASFAAGGFDDNIREKRNTVQTVYVIDEEIMSIDIDDIEHDIVIRPSEDGVCRLTCLENEAVRHSFKVENKTLTVVRNDSRRWFERLFSFSFGKTSLTLTLPYGTYYALAVEAVSGDIRIENGFTFESASLSTVSGDIAFASASQKTLTASANSGSISVKGTIAETISLSVTSGDIEMKTVSADTLSASAVSGDIEAETVLAKETMILEAVSGDIDLDGCDAKHLKIETVSGDVEGILLTPKHFFTQTVSGKVRVPTSVAGGGRCEISTTSGDITLSIPSR